MTIMRWCLAAAALVPLVVVGAETPAVRPPATSSAPVPAGTFPPCVSAAVGALSLEERAGQLLMVGVPANAPRGLGGLVARYHLGGAFLSGRSVRPAADLRGDLAALRRRVEPPLLVAVDQEGGSVQTLKGPDFPLIPSARRLGAGPKAVLRDTVRDNAGRLARIGVSVNLAPVADTVPAGLGEGNPPIGAFHREYGSDPVRVAEDVRTVVPASQGAGVLTILKHFPGLGRVRANTDTSTRAVDRTATVGDAYLEPFVAGIDAGSAGVMISSASYPRLDPEAIAAFSRPIVTGLLRDRLGYTGLIMSDDLGAADAVESVPTGDRAVRFVDAGGDLVLTIRPQNVGPMIAALLAAARGSPVFADRVTDAAAHVLHAKYRAGLLSCA
ncbi:glycoside hydrolase family 3 N-terminal domain-containing protein [Amorphoplanes digitatis]|uniref:beta-N-acetylhexosaminidase n=1 Tax=Actinoplanes digitatis TaxID=1868 RepID=A0A7W7HWP1_9ACTN|nr:glycoside hydrolase family 3 N-terminal domain-containing protein [Actinoplanes digitatis]MBB4762178.1 beta-N-acetylhexosaminidase [Actinoplanes digitatis]BFE70944.1 glycoside hydrolase family 3 protein [Actinoplanes digitatis]GID96272.1 beta-glucosidase [Actinoplanes digitatis]